ncbi:MAG: hypothetical protein R3B48_14875 [Kofleriaceae bacterium]
MPRPAPCQPHALDLRIADVGLLSENAALPSYCWDMKFKTFAALLSATLLAPACSGDQAPKHSAATSYALMDTNHNGVADAIDLNSNNVADLRFGVECARPLIQRAGSLVPMGLDLDCDGALDTAWCAEPLVDSDDDGVPDALDLDCDGDIDVDLDLPEICVPELLDRNNDDLPDALDTDCDGAADIDLSFCVPHLIDANDDHLPDGLDTDCDGEADVSFPTLPAACDPLVDGDGDGHPDGLDLDCDGTVEYELPH